MTHSQPEPITPPENFPVTWENPEDARLLWTLDRLHTPEPNMPMTTSARARYMAGRVRAFQHYGRPVAAEPRRRINTYHYSAVVAPDLSAEELAARAEAGLRRAEAAALRLDELWHNEFLPEIKAHLAYWDSFDLRGATLPALLTHLDDSLKRAERLWEIHFLMPMALARNQFAELYTDLFGQENALEAHRLVQGFDNLSLQMGRALWRLSRMALNVPAVHQVFVEQRAADVLPMLERLGEAEPFLAALRTFLNEYGRRSDGWDWGYPSWHEDPTAVVQLVQLQMRRSDYDPLTELHALAAEREQLVAQTRERLKGYPQPVRDQFETLLKAAQFNTVLLEDHNFYIDFLGMYYLRQVILEFGRRIAEAGALQRPSDVFYLMLDELRDTADAQPFSDRRTLVAERRAEMEYWRNITAPLKLGTPSNTPPLTDSLSRSMSKFFGAPLASTNESNVLRGHAGSPGKVRAPAKVIHSLAEAGKLQPGDVLVTDATAPPWTPLFAIVSAVVTDAGGVLSHCAVVAREYRIPAVVGTGNATQVIRDGQMLEVDGSAGVVRLLPAEEII